MSIKSLVTYIIIVSAICYSWLSQTPSASDYQDQDLTKFSQQRALAHLNQISRLPHYTSSDEHHNVRNYIVEELAKMGLDVQIIDSLATSAKYYSSADVSNIIARLPANIKTIHQKPSAKAVALVSHYDSSIHSSLGASDAGSGVVTILEGIRAFIANESKHSNDIYVIITDAEENGLLGAQAFVSHNPLAQDIGLVLNFEARGSGGASFMLLETNYGNKQLIEAFADANIAHPVGNSLMYSIYKMLPNDTDLTVFREKGDINGFNFAFIDDHFDYHTAQDTVNRLDLDSLNHQADYLTALLPYFANTDLTMLNSNEDLVYFNFANLAVYHYPFTWVLPLCVLATIMFVALIFVGIRKSKLTIKYMLLGFIPCIASLVVSIGIGIYGWRILTFLLPQLTDIPHGFPYSGHAIIGAAILLVLLAGILIYQVYLRIAKHSALPELLVAPLTIWLAINFFIAFNLSGAGFYIIVVYGLLAAMERSLRTEIGAISNPLLFAFYALPGLIIIAPQIPILTVGLGLASLATSTGLTILLAMSILPAVMSTNGLKYISIFMLIGVGFFSYQIISLADYSKDRKKPSGINYVYDTQSAQAYLFTYTELDQFTENFFTTSDRNTDLVDSIFPALRGRHPQFAVKAETIDIIPAGYIARQKSTLENTFELTLEIQANRKLNGLQLITDREIILNKIQINGKDFGIANKKQRKGLIWRHTPNNTESLVLELTYLSEGSPSFRLIEFAYDLSEKMPQTNNKLDWMMPTPFRIYDATIVSQHLKFD